MSSAAVDKEVKNRLLAQGELQPEAAAKVRDENREIFETAMPDLQALLASNGITPPGADERLPVERADPLETRHPSAAPDRRPIEPEGVGGPSLQ